MLRIRPSFRVMGCQKAVIVEENHAQHLTADGPTFYTRFRLSNVSRSGSAAAPSAVSSIKDAVSKEHLVRPGFSMAVQPLQAFFSQGTPFASFFPLFARKGFQGWSNAESAEAPLVSPRPRGWGRIETANIPENLQCRMPNKECRIKRFEFILHSTLCILLWGTTPHNRVGGEHTHGISASPAS